MGTATVTCQTSGCAKQGEAVPDVAISYTDEETGETREVDQVICGVCGNPISEVVRDA